jgi:phage baseplate assembly protein W
MANLDESLLRDIVHISDLKLSSKGDIDTISGLENVKNALFHRLVTLPGSLAHRPGYGVGISRFQNAVASLSVQREIAGRIQEQFEEDPRVEGVKSVKVIVDDKRPDLVTFIVKVKIRGYGETEAKFIPFGEGV